MPNQFDWPMIRAAWERGVPVTEIANSVPQSPSRQAISKRATKEGWQVARSPDSEATGPVDKREVVIAKIRSGSPQKLAALAAGISESTFYLWCNSDESFRSLVQAARAAHLTTNVERIDNAADRDWKAAAYLLERSPETKDQFSQKQDAGGVTIVLAIDRTQGITIEHEG